MNSPHFTESELACSHCGVNRIRLEALTMLEAFRSAIKVPVIVNDAYRCATHNQAIGGVPNSQHVLGRAADVRVTNANINIPVDVLEAVALSLTADGTVTGIGRDDHKQYIHIDCRRTATGQVPRDITGHVQVARWCYAPDGSQVDWYPVPIEPITVVGAANVVPASALPLVVVQSASSPVPSPSQATSPIPAPENVSPALESTVFLPPAAPSITQQVSHGSGDGGEFTSHVVTSVDPVTGTATVTPPLKSTVAHDTLLDRLKKGFKV